MGGCVSKDEGAGQQQPRKNQVAPHPSDNHPQQPLNNAKPAAGAGKPRALQTGNVTTAGLVYPPSPHAGPGGKHGLSPAQEAAVKSHPLLKEVVDACLAAAPNTAATVAPRLRELLHRVTPVLEQLSGRSHQQPSVPAIPKEALQGTVQACCRCIDKLLAPLLAGAERALSSTGASSNSLPGTASPTPSGPSNTRWDILSITKVMEAMTLATRSSYDSPQAWEAARGAATTAASLLERLHSAAMQAGPAGAMRVDLVAFSVPTVNALVNMLGVVFFRKVTLESQVRVPAVCVFIVCVGREGEGVGWHFCC